MTSEEVEMPLVFNGSGNQLADAFKQLYLSQIMVGCSKIELERWIQKNFQYYDNCNRPFSWRKKWEKGWDNVKYCSDKCRINKDKISKMYDKK